MGIVVCGREMNQEAKQIAARWWADKLEIEGKREEFYQALWPKIEPETILDVDYDPCETLLYTLHEVGIRCRGVLFSARGIFPYKTTMSIRKGRVSVSDGYGSKWDVIATYQQSKEVLMERYEHSTRILNRLNALDYLDDSDTKSKSYHEEKIIELKKELDRSYPDWNKEGE